MPSFAALLPLLLLLAASSSCVTATGPPHCTVYQYYGAYYCDVGPCQYTQCYTCPARYYCDGTSKTICPAGFYCMGGTLNANPVQCPAASTCPTDGMSCPTGYTCSAQDGKAYPATCCQNNQCIGTSYNASSPIHDSHSGNTYCCPFDAGIQSVAENNDGTSSCLCPDTQGVQCFDGSTQGTFYAWQQGGYGACTGGTQVQSVTCIDTMGVQVADAQCNAADQPPTTVSCYSATPAPTTTMPPATTEAATSEAATTEEATTISAPTTDAPTTTIAPTQATSTAAVTTSAPSNISANNLNLTVWPYDDTCQTNVSGQTITNHDTCTANSDMAGWSNRTILSSHVKCIHYLQPTTTTVYYTYYAWTVELYEDLSCSQGIQVSGRDSDCTSLQAYNIPGMAAITVNCSSLALGLTVKGAAVHLELASLPAALSLAILLLQQLLA